MTITENSKDYLWTADGDLYIDPNSNGGPEVASFRRDEIISSSIFKRLNSTQGDWEDFPTLGADLTDFVGLPNTRETAALIEGRIYNTLVQDLLIRSEDIAVDIVPIGQNTILVMVLISSLENESPVVTGFSFDMRDNIMIPRIINV